MTTPTTNFSWPKPVNNADSDTWGTELNTIFDDIDAALGSGASGAALNPLSIKLGSGSTLSTYVKGTWTPTDQSGAGLTFTVNHAVYIRIGDLVTVQAEITYPATADVSSAVIGGLPFAVPSHGRGTCWALVSSSFAILISGSSNFSINQVNGTAQSNANLSTGTVVFDITYSVT